MIHLQGKLFLLSRLLPTIFIACEGVKSYTLTYTHCEKHTMYVHIYGGLACKVVEET